MLKPDGAYFNSNFMPHPRSLSHTPNPLALGQGLHPNPVKGREGDGVNGAVPQRKGREGDGTGQGPLCDYSW